MLILNPNPKPAISTRVQNHRELIRIANVLRHADDFNIKGSSQASSREKISQASSLDERDSCSFDQTVQQSCFKLQIEDKQFTMDDLNNVDEVHSQGTPIFPKERRRIPSPCHDMEVIIALNKL